MTFEEAVRKGLPYRGDGTKSESIGGDRIRRLLLELAAKDEEEPEGEARGRIITSAGIVIEGSEDCPIAIAGERREGGNEDIIDLSYLAGRNGGPLPPLVFRHCVLLANLRLAGSHFAFLSIEDCAIQRIDADHCKIDNHCRLIGLTGIQGETTGRVAQIRMVGAHINGTADLRGCRLVAPPFPGRGEAEASRKTVSRKYADRFALSLATAEIGGRLLLDQGFTAEGGVSLYQTTIRNSLSLNTARLESLSHEVPALDAEDIRLSGSFMWVNEPPRSDEEHEHNQWHVAGRIILRRAEIGGDIKLEHCRWAERGALSIRHPPVRNGPKVDHISGGIDARAANIAGQLRIGQGCIVGRWRTPPSRRSDEDLGSGVFGASLDAWKARIGKGVRIEGIEPHARFTGPIFLNDTTIDHGIILLGDVDMPEVDVATEKVPEALDLSDARVTGLVRLRCRLSGSAILRRASIDGTIEIQELEFRPPLLLPGDCRKDCRDGTATLLDLSSATITGALHLGGITTSHPRPWTAILEAVMDPKTRLSHVRCTADDIVECHDLAGGVAVLVEGGALLTGEAEQVRLMFKRTDPIPTPVSVSSFVRFHLDHVVDDCGARTVRHLGEPREREPIEGGGWELKDCEFAVGAGWRRADLVVTDDYELERINEREIADDEEMPPRDIFRIGPFRFPSQPCCGKDRLAQPEPLREALGAYFKAHLHRPAIFDLRGLSCRTFDDNQAEVWTKLWGGDQREWRLLLDGIDFIQFDRTDPKERSARSRARAELAESKMEETRRPASRKPPPLIVKRALHRRNATLALTVPKQVPWRRVFMLHSFVAGQKGFVAGQKGKEWDDLEPLASDNEFSPQPFEIFARAYIRSGEHRTSDEVIAAQKRLEWTDLFIRAKRAYKLIDLNLFIRAGLFSIFFILLFIVISTVTKLVDPSQPALVRVIPIALFLLWPISYAATQAWPWVLRRVGRLFDRSFFFGLKPRRAAKTLASCLILGVLVAILLGDNLKPVARSHAMRFDEGPAPESHGSADAQTPQARAIAHTRLPADPSIEGCNVVDDNWMDRTIYTFDVFVPLIDLRQECAYTILPEAWWLRWLKAFYAAVGWVVMSLTLLTISGVLRRDLEK